MNRFIEFQKNYDQAITSINFYLNHSGMKNITKFLLETEANPYSFLPEGWAGNLESAQDFTNLLHHIDHALFDDGDISFPVINDEPHISFVCKNEDNAEFFVLSEQEQEYAKNGIAGRKVKYTVTWLNTIDDFIREREKFDIEECREYFLMRCFENIPPEETNNIEQATKEYQDKKYFDPIWIQEAKINYKSKWDVRKARKSSKMGELKNEHT